MRRTASERKAEAARAQQITEQALHKQSRKATPELAQAAFDKLTARPELMEALKRLSIR